MAEREALYPPTTINTHADKLGFAQDRLKRIDQEAEVADQALSVAPFPSSEPYFFGGSIMMCAPGVPGSINHGPPSLALMERPVDCGVANGT